MKTKIITIAVLILSIYFNAFAATYNITQNDQILVTTGYVNNMNDTWNIVSTVTDKPLKITYNNVTEYGADYVTIKSVDDYGVETTLITLSGSRSGVISTMIPNGKAKIIFTTNGSTCYATNPSVYTGLNMTFAVDNDNVINNNLHTSGDIQTNNNLLVNGKVGIGTTTPTKKLEIVEGTGGRFSFSAANCTSGYEVAQTIDNTGYKLNIGTSVRDYRIAINGSDKFAINTSGNVGIGTNTPQAGLHVTKVSTISNTNVAAILGNDYNHFTYFGGTTGGRIRGANDGYLVLESNPNGTGDKNLYLNFQSSSNILMALGGGNVGIGTTSPSEKLTVAGGHGDTKIRLYSIGNGSNMPSNLSLWASEPGLTYQGTGIGYNVNGSPNYGRIDNTQGSSFVRFLPGETKFQFQNASGSNVEALTIKETGNIGINTNNPIGKFDIQTAPNQHIQFLDNVNGALSGCVGIVSINDGNTAYTPMGFYASKYYFGNGNMGIGTTSPSKKLDVEIDDDYQLRLGNGNGLGYNIGRNVGTGYLNFYGDQSGYNGYVFGGVNGTLMSIMNNGKVSIGTTIPDNTPNVLLTVNGAIHAKEVLVDMNILADYVFSPDYSLMPLQKVEAFVKTNKHLPEIPSAAEVKEKGLSMGEMQNKLLQKIEELTLYVIELEKRVNDLTEKQTK